jgi:hypothetical protein
VQASLREAIAASRRRLYQLKGHKDKLISRIGMVGDRALRDWAGDGDASGASVVGLPADHRSCEIMHAQQIRSLHLASGICRNYVRMNLSL